MSMSAPGVAAGKALKSQPTPFEGAVFFDGFNHVFRTSGRVPAGRHQPWRYHTLVNGDQRDEQGAEEVIQKFQSCKITF